MERATERTDGKAERDDWPAAGWDRPFALDFMGASVTGRWIERRMKGRAG
ncbi:MAG: hypothetical protein ACOCUZ_02380 [bacterium]